MQENLPEKEQEVINGFASRIALLRKERSLTLAAFAAAINVSRQGYARWEQGEIPDVLLALHRLWTNWGTDLHELITGEKTESSQAVRDENVALRQKNSELSLRLAELERKVGQLPGAPGDVSLLQADGWKRERLEDLAQLSGQNKVWRVLRELENRAQTDESLAGSTGLELTWIRGCLLLLEYQSLVERAGDEWHLAPTGIVVLRSSNPADVAAHALEAVDFLIHRVLPGAITDRSILGSAQITVAGDRPGERLFNALKVTMSEVEDPTGMELRVVIGIAPLKEGG